MIIASEVCFSHTQWGHPFLRSKQHYGTPSTRKFSADTIITRDFNKNYSGHIVGTTVVFQFFFYFYLLIYNKNIYIKIRISAQ